MTLAAEAMSAKIEGLEPDAVEDLLKTQNALETAFRSADGDAQDMIVQNLRKAKIGELGGADELQDYEGGTRFRKRYNNKIYL